MEIVDPVQIGIGYELMEVVEMRTGNGKRGTGSVERMLCLRESGLIIRREKWGDNWRIKYLHHRIVSVT